MTTTPHGPPPWGVYKERITTKYLQQFCVILGFSLLGELAHKLIPFPIPASIWGMAALFLALALKLVKVEQIKETGGFLTAILSVLFVAPAVNLLDCWGQIAPHLGAIGVVIVVSLLVTFGVSGLVTQALLKRGGQDG